MRTRQDASFGVVPLRRGARGWEVFLITHKKGHTSFPKGHPLPGETPEETAARELKEEADLVVAAWLDIPVLVEQYIFRAGEEWIEKTVTYFAAAVEGEGKHCEQEQTVAGRWVLLDEAEQHITFPGAKAISAKVQAWLRDEMD